MKLARRIIVTAAAVAACAATVVATTASSHTRNPDVLETAADAEPGHAVEGFDYPNAEKIKEETGIILKRGDGHVMLVACSSGTGLLEVKWRGGKTTCFRTTGSSGFLSLEMPAVHAVKGSADHSADVTLTAPKGKDQHIEVPSGEWTAVGEPLVPANQYNLVEIRTSK
ncbi:hypothetical protein CP973_30140 [Streptomyces albofaciens JCM 4342]|uniref:hypothetical protein n=1 Tax=Streptomyces albofaciens TaxID=66866 RepID=UPI00123ADF8E|nr:hypothetical protein [Streptomyces albofaciens]KAA6213486.1 hypothetical protein CP973_30140 [Streptomyces albofaciens JCM 4342]